MLQLVHANHEAAAEGHKRNRERVESATGRIASLEAGFTDLRERMAAIERTPLNVERVTFSSRQLAAIVGGCLIVAGTMWQLHIGINDVQAAIVNSAKLQDERTAMQNKAIDDLGRNIEMRRVEIQRLSDKLTEFMQAKTK